MCIFGVKSATFEANIFFAFLPVLYVLTEVYDTPNLLHLARSPVVGAGVADLGLHIPPSVPLYQTSRPAPVFTVSDPAPPRAPAAAREPAQ